MYVAYVGRTWKNDPHRAGYWVNSLQRPLHFAAQPKAQTSAEIGAVGGRLERRQANFCARYSNEGANYYVFLHNDGMFFLYILYIIYILLIYVFFASTHLALPARNCLKSVLHRGFFSWHMFAPSTVIGNYVSSAFVGLLPSSRSIPWINWCHFVAVIFDLSFDLGICCPFELKSFRQSLISIHLKLLLPAQSSILARGNLSDTLCVGSAAQISLKKLVASLCFGNWCLWSTPAMSSSFRRWGRSHGMKRTNLSVLAKQMRWNMLKRFMPIGNSNAEMTCLTWAFTQLHCPPLNLVVPYFSSSWSNATCCDMLHPTKHLR